MLILIDLDGTLINTLHPSWKPYKDGVDNFPIEPYLSQIPFFPGAKEFIESRKKKGDSLIVVSDSHFRYVEPICKMLGVECVSLADKPNAIKLNEFLDKYPDYKQCVKDGNCFVIGDTKLDIEMGRHIGALTIWFTPYVPTDEIKDERDGIGDNMSSIKRGPTFVANTFEYVEHILDNPLESLYSVEAIFAGSQSEKAICFSDIIYSDRTQSQIRCLARQEQGICDKYARADKYYMLSHAHRSKEFIDSIARGVANYINQPSFRQKWDFITYISDKATTNPPNKMKEIFDRIETDLPKIQLFKWADNVPNSLRHEVDYQNRKNFLNNYLTIDCSLMVESESDDLQKDIQAQPLKDKSVVVIDDQLTTGATAWYAIKTLKDNGAKNVLFIAIFQMILAVNNDVVCPRCGRPMQIKMRRSDGRRFYSCYPPAYGGNGCGYILNIQD